MSFIDPHLEWMNRQKDWGWPEWLSKDDREWLVSSVRDTLTKYGPMRLRRLYELATCRDLHPDVPQAVTEARLWDALLGITHKAAITADAEELWHLPPHDWRDRIPARHDDPALWDRLDPYRGDKQRLWQPLGVHDDALCYDTGKLIVRRHAETGRWRCYLGGIPLKDARGAVRSWSKPSAACKAGVGALATCWAGQAREENAV